MRAHKPYLFYGQTTSLCESCLTLVPAKIMIEANNVFFHKHCWEHGVQKTLVSTDASYYKRCREFLKPGDMPLTFQSRTHFGCPYDCGLCPDHEQHSCLALIEINDTCNLTCPVCFADSSPQRAGQLSLSQVEAMMDALVASEGEPDLLQISGGEPTLHPQILPILHLAKRKPIRHLMLNTNGVRIANDRQFVEELARLKPGFEVYLQFDSRRQAALENIRGADLRHIRERALANLEAVGLSTTLVCVIKKGVNDDEVGEIVRHALNYACVRGVTFQPVQDAGRNVDFDDKRDRVLLTDIRRGIVEHSGIFGDEDMIPLPCNPEAIAIGYGLRVGHTVMPITRMIPQEVLISDAPNTITFEKHPGLRQRLFDLLSLSSAGLQTDSSLYSLLCCLPQVEVPSALGYDRVFRVLVVQFMDRFNFCVGGVKRSCIHFVTPERQIIPFDTYNLFYRPGASGNAALARARGHAPVRSPERRASASLRHGGCA